VSADAGAAAPRRSRNDRSLLLALRAWVAAAPAPAWMGPQAGPSGGPAADSGAPAPREAASAAR
jgi:hypothetical protein